MKMRVIIIEFIGSTLIHIGSTHTGSTLIHIGSTLIHIGVPSQRVLIY